MTAITENEKEKAGTAGDVFAESTSDDSSENSLKKPGSQAKAATSVVHAPNKHARQQGTGFSASWTRIVQDYVHEPITTAVLAVSMVSARNPRQAVSIMVVFSLFLLIVGLFTNFELSDEEDIIWTPDPSKALSHGQWIDSQKSGYPADTRWFFLLVHNQGEDVLSRTGVARVFEAIEAVRATDGYATVCPNDTEDCHIEAVTRFWNDDQATFEAKVSTDEETAQALSADTFPDGTPVDIFNLLGNPTVDRETGVLTFAQTYMITIDLPGTDEAKDFEEIVGEDLLKLRDSWEDDGADTFQLDFYTDTAFDLEFDRAVEEDMLLVPLVFVIMGIFTSLYFARRHKVRSRSLLGFGAVCSVLLSIMTGYGLLFCIGTPFTSVTQMLPFIMFGIGLDDAYIMKGAYDRTDPKHTPAERIEATMTEVGLSIAMTTITSMAAFALGCLSSIPPLDWLCLYAFPTVFIIFIYHLIFTVGIIVIDEERIANNRRDCCPCCVAQDGDAVDDNEQEADQARNAVNEGDEEDVPEEPFVDRFIVRYAGFLLQPWVKAVVILAFAGMFSGFAYCASNLTQEFKFTDVLPDDSYVTDLWIALNEFSDREALVPASYFRFVDQSDPDIQRQMIEYVEEIVSLPYFPNPPTYFWLPDFLELVETNATMMTGLTFEEQVDVFLSDPVNEALYSGDIIRDDQGNILTSRVHLNMDDINQDVVKEVVDALKDQREVSRKAPINQGRDEWAFFTFEGEFYIFSFYERSAHELAITTILGVASVTVLGIIFIPHWSAVFFIGPLICMLYVDLLGFMQVCGLHINPVSYVALIMSIGLLVDFVMHMLLRYYESVGNPQEKVVGTLRTMGASILVGGVSTFLGVLPLAFSTSDMFNNVFIVFIGLVVFGLAHAVILMPVLLSIFGPGSDSTPPRLSLSALARRSLKQQASITERWDDVSDNDEYSV